jgi:hypothetical protein
MEGLFSNSLGQLKSIALEQTPSNMVVCYIYSYNLSSLFQRIKLMCQKYGFLKSQLGMLEIVIQFHNNMVQQGLYDPDKGQIKKSCQLWFKQKMDYWYIISGAYSGFATQVKKFPELLPKIQKKDEKWIVANIDRILEAQIFTYSNKIVKEVLADLNQISASDKNDIWEFLEVLVENCHCEDELISETKFV